MKQYSILCRIKHERLTLFLQKSRKTSVQSHKVCKEKTDDLLIYIWIRETSYLDLIYTVETNMNKVIANELSHNSWLCKTFPAPTGLKQLPISHN